MAKYLLDSVTFHDTERVKYVKLTYIINDIMIAFSNPYLNEDIAFEHFYKGYVADKLPVGTLYPIQRRIIVTQHSPFFNMLKDKGVDCVSPELKMYNVDVSKFEIQHYSTLPVYVPQVKMPNGQVVDMFSPEEAAYDRMYRIIARRMSRA